MASKEELREALDDYVVQTSRSERVRWLAELDMAGKLLYNWPVSMLGDCGKRTKGSCSRMAKQPGSGVNYATASAKNHFQVAPESTFRST